MSYMNEYIEKGYSAYELEVELQKLIHKYNKERNTYLFVFSTANEKRLRENQLDQEDYYTIFDMLNPKKGLSNLDFYLETPGGSGEAAEEIVRFLHNNFSHISFVISGEAKSAGTIMALSGHEIFMTETGSLGPIDAQVPLGRSIVSAYDYLEWVKKKREEAEKNETLNPFDAIMIAQITPGELEGIEHAYKYAQDLVIQWLTEYKFKNWNITEERGISVTEEMKQNRAKQIAETLCNHAKWRLHGRSIKIQDLHYIGLKINQIDDNPRLAELVYRIQTVCRLIFTSTTAYKIYATQDTKLFKHAAPIKQPNTLPPASPPEVIEARINCPQCGKNYTLYMKFIDDPKIDNDFLSKGFLPYPRNDKIRCSCNYEIDLSGMRNEIEMQVGKKIILKPKRGVDYE
ncbi:Serine dehydrogenase proteinase [Carboxydocella thermautotrophica]|nr:Serine dehydrogenase proteinase [Carboxydocella thermautotrophica]